MTTDYDPIAEQYQRSKQQPWRIHIEAYSLMELIGDPTELSVIDMACGEGFYSRMLKQKGAAKVTGIDLSAEMVNLARQQETENNLGIEYIQGDARDSAGLNPCDLVVAAYLLNYARDREELQAMCTGIARCLKPGGRFVTINSSPLLNFATAPSYRKYDFETQVTGIWEEGAPITWIFYLEDGPLLIENYYLSAHTHEQEFRSAGFRRVNWHVPRLSPTGLAEYEDGFWSRFMEQPPVALIECIR